MHAAAPQRQAPGLRSACSSAACTQTRSVLLGYFPAAPRHRPLAALRLRRAPCFWPCPDVRGFLGTAAPRLPCLKGHSGIRLETYVRPIVQVRTACAPSSLRCRSKYQYTSPLLSIPRAGPLCGTVRSVLTAYWSIACSVSMHAGGTQASATACAHRRKPSRVGLLRAAGCPLRLVGFIASSMRPLKSSRSSRASHSAFSASTLRVRRWLWGEEGWHARINLACTQGSLCSSWALLRTGRVGDGATAVQNL